MQANKEEILKMIKYIKSMQMILRTSTSQEQIERVKKDLSKYLQKLQSLVPDFDPKNETIQELERRIETIIDGKNTDAGRSLHSEYPQTESSWDNRIRIMKPSPHSNDPEINFLYSVMTFLQKEYWPAVSEQQIQLDYTYSQERHGLRFQFDELMRELRSIIETIEDQARTANPDLKEQLQKMKTKQIRTFIINANEYFKKLRDFLEKLIDEHNKKSFVIKNPDSRIQFHPRFDEASLLNGYTIPEALVEFLDLVQYIIRKINLPDLKQKKF